MAKPTPPIDQVDAAFLGPMAENATLFESWVVQAVRDYAYWRKNAHPEDPAAISAKAQHSEAFQDVSARTDDALRRLAARLKRSVPWFSPRYIGHMSSDLLMAGLVGRILGVLYNPNNVSDDAGGPSVALELEVGESLATMFGMDDALGARRPWGHLTSGGTVANYEALRVLQALRHYPPALAVGLEAVGLDLREAPALATLVEADAWGRANVALSEVMVLRAQAFALAARVGRAAALHEAVDAARLETLGAVGFAEGHGIPPMVIVAPVSAHYSWSRGAKLIGLGKQNIVSVSVDERMRMDAGALRETLAALHAERRPVLAAVCVYGTTEFGTLDPVHELVRARDEFAKQGLHFGLHVDAAWGGYLASLFREPDGSLRPLAEMREAFRYFPSDGVYVASAALGCADSITVDPHKLGFIPYPAGALVFRDREWARLQLESAPYVFDDAEAVDEAPLSLSQLGKYVIEGSKPGSSATSVAVAHDVFPLHAHGFGEVIARTIRSSEAFFDRVRSMQERLSGVARLAVPFEPDTNIVCLGVSAESDPTIAGSNALTRRLFETMKFSPDEPTQVREFIGSFTSLHRERMTDAGARRLESALGLTRGELEGDRHLFVLRHTLMNPWLLRPSSSGVDYVDAYLARLEASIRDAV